jgi:hypothetical protein
MAGKRREDAAPRWRFLVERPTAYNPSVRPDGTDAVPWGRSWTLASDAKRVLVEVEATAAALAAYTDGTLPKTGRRAIQSEGRSAVETYLSERKLPDRIRITAQGVRKG